MCTTFIKKGKDLIYGYNLDIDEKQYNFSLYKTDKLFSVGIKIGSTLYYTHGITSDGVFGNLPYMNGEEFIPPKNSSRARIDLLVNRLLRGKYSFSDVEKILNEKVIVSPPKASMHSLLCSKDGKVIIVEPKYGNKEVSGDYVCLTNFPVLTKLENYDNVFYGKDRYDTVNDVLSKFSADFTAKDGLNLLNLVKQTGRWGTKISFVYSKNDNAVYYTLNGDFDNVYIHYFKKGV